MRKEVVFLIVLFEMDEILSRLEVCYQFVCVSGSRNEKGGFLECVGVGFDCSFVMELLRDFGYFIVLVFLCYQFFVYNIRG